MNAFTSASSPRFLRADDVPSWLDDIEGEQSLAWAREWNEKTLATVDNAAQQGARDNLRTELLQALDTDSRIPYPVRRGDHLYNFWRDAKHPRGVWRRTTLGSFLSKNTEWDVLIDVDSLAATDGENWVWKGAQCRYPDYDRALIHLSRGGADATVIREFDLTTGRFVADADDPFFLPEAKSDVSWVSRDEILVGTDCGPDSLTDSGYPRQVRKWSRGQDLADSEQVFAGHKSDVAVGGWFDNTEGFERLFVERAQDFYTSQRFVAVPRQGKLPHQFGGTFSLQIIEVPDDCRVSAHKEWLVLMPRTEFNGIPAGAVAVAEFDEWLSGNRDVEILFTPDSHTSFQSLAWTHNYLVVTLLNDVSTKLLTLSIGDWAEEAEFTGLPDQATISVVGTSPTRDDEIWLSSSSMTEPPTLWLGTAGSPEARVARRAPAFFDPAGMDTRQHWATSADGTQIPYRITGRLGSTETPNTAPTLVHAYGGFEVSLVPGYSPVRGIGWLAKGGFFVEANLRGGGEFGPEWHSSVVKKERMRVYEDHQAVLRDIVARGYCSVEQLAVRGGSNGGLLTAVCLTSYPELVGSVVSQVPLADMLRYHRLSAGASWMAEYGNPDVPDERAAIEEYSPVHRVAKREDVEYPPALVTTSTRDDRVHPAHARSLAWLLREAGHDVDYFENIEGGHAGAADNSQVAMMESLIYTWLWEKLN
ncbi:prolyl oligopeptidase family serine peptidase [Corynebacterium sp. H78]|uniref:prolyl oligopeptidase family serine peptidase n=1 Tax=Corynebacterium sp. H78 TaxID=3133417 RepID=UPI0030A23926